MKKINVLAALAFVAAGLFTTSCSDNGEFAGMNITAEGEDVFALVAHSDVPASFTYGGQTLVGTDVTFETQVEDGVLTVTADGYLPQTANVSFSETKTLNKIDVTLVKESTINVEQSEAKGNTVSNDSENQSVMGLQGILSVAKDVNISGNTKDPFSAVIFEPAPQFADVMKQKEGDVVNVPLIAVRCEPDGAQFDKPISVFVDMNDTEGFDLSCPTAFQGTQVVADARGITAQVGHFSNVFVAANAQLVKTVNKSTTSKVRLKVKAGENVYKYNEYTGYKATYKTGSVEDRFLKSQYGAYASVSRETTFNASSDGYAEIETTQYIYDVTWRSGRVTVRATVYGRFYADATVDGKTVRLHTGGSN